MAYGPLWLLTPTSSLGGFTQHMERPTLPEFQRCRHLLRPKLEKRATQRLGVRDNLHGITRDYMDSAQLLRTDLSDTTRPDLDPGQLQDHSENAQKSVRFPPNRPISRKSVCIHV